MYGMAYFLNFHEETETKRDDKSSHHFPTINSITESS